MTKDQAKILQYVKDCGDVTPTYREMAAHLGWKSWGGIRAILDALVLRGELERFDGKSRGLRVVSSPWRPIATAPKDGTELLVYIRPKVVRLGWWFAPSSRTFGWCDENGKRIYPTHWQAYREPRND